MLRSRLLLSTALLFLLLTLLASAGEKAGPTAGMPTYITDHHPNLLVHRPAGFPVKETEVLVKSLKAAIGRHLEAHQFDEKQALQVWLLPEQAVLPDGLTIAPVADAVWAGGPFTLVARTDALQDLTGVDDAVAVAISQSAGSPVFKSTWLYAGMAAVWQADPETFPANLYSDGKVQSAVHLLDRLSAPAPAIHDQEYPAWRKAAGLLAAFTADRLGIDWPRHFPPPDLSPEGVLIWTTGAGKAEALQRWQKRMEGIPTDPKQLSYFSTLADLSPVRAQPALPLLPAGPGPNPNASPHTYSITARYEPSRREVVGKLELTWQNGEGIPVSRLWFNLWANAEQYARFGGGITIERVLADGRSAAFTARGMDLQVPLGRELQPGEKATLAIDFTTRLPAGITQRVFGQSGERRFNLAHWYPQLAVLDDRGWNLHPLPRFPGEPYHETADYQVTLDLPAGTQLAATGHLDRLEQGKERWLYHYSAPRVRDWAATGGYGLAEKLIQVGHVRIQVIDTHPSWVGAAAEKVERALPFFAERFGPYPSDDLVVTCCAGLEYPGLFYGSAVSPDGVRWIHTLHHELAHMWFYSLVGNDQFTEPWLDESFARYADRTIADAFLIPWSRTTIKLPDGLRTSSSSAAYFLQPSAYGNGVYGQGADTLMLLEEKIGKAAFDRLLKEWVLRYRFKTATGADFVRLAEEVSGTRLGDFFAERGIDPGDRVPYQPLIPWPAAVGQ